MIITQQNIIRARWNTFNLCIYLCMPKTKVNCWPASFEVITPPPKLALPRPRRSNFREKPAQNWGGNQAKSAIFGGGRIRTQLRIVTHSDVRSRLSRTASNPTRLIRPHPIDGDRVSEQPVNKIFLIFPGGVWKGTILFILDTLSVSRHHILQKKPIAG